MRAPETFRFDTFGTDEWPGSPQWLHIYHSRAAFDNAIAQLTVNDEYDHTVLFVEDDSRAHARSFNRHGAIQLCGSGLYASAWLLSPNMRTHWALQTEHISVSVSTSDTTPTLHLPAHALTPFHIDAANIACPEGVMAGLTQDLMDGLIKGFIHKPTGIALFELNTLSDLETIHHHEAFKIVVEHEAVHAAGFFYWSGDQSTGHVRYFVPKYGRKEDYVTGSIHAYLTPLIHDKYGVHQQTWIQDSSLPGCLNTRYGDQSVALTGRCRLVDQSGFKR